MRAVIAVLVVLAACENPPLSLRYRLTHGDSQQCFGDGGDVTTDCQDVTMICPAYLSVRILRPSEQDAPYISLCEPLIHPQNKLCGIAGIDLPQPTTPIPEQTLEVQMAIFPDNDTTIVPDPITGKPVCPRVEFGANGLPRAVIPNCTEEDPFDCPRVPAIGGRTFYHPGDTETVVDLGCTDLDQLTNAEVCNSVTLIDVTATVADFANLVTSVDQQVADRLSVSVGEPVPFDDTHVLNNLQIHPLDPVMSSSPSWAAQLTNPDFSNTACLAVREDGAETTTTLTCRALNNPSDDFDISGVFLDKEVLSTILGSLGFAKFPAKGGLVVGIVINENFEPIPGQQVSCGLSGCTIQYLSMDLSTVVTGGTSTSGVFVTRDATFGTVFSVGPNVEPAIGGVVEGKVTIVVLRDKGSIITP